MPESQLLDANGQPVHSSPEPEIPIEWDKAAPKGPPSPPSRQIPPHLQPVVDYLVGAVADEALLLDLCLERAIRIIRHNHDGQMVGIDYFPDAVGAQFPTPLMFESTAAPIAIELYKQVLESLNGGRKEAFEKVVSDALALRPPQG